MAEPETRSATYADLAAVPDGFLAQIVDGELVVLPRHAIPHQLAASELASDLVVRFGRGRDGPGGWWILYEPELHLARDVLVPDLAGYRRERMPELPRTPFLSVAPDWICEVLSPATARHDRIGKMRAYARERVGHVWIVDPEARTLEVYRRDGDHWLQLAVHGADERVRAEPFDAVALDLAPLWGTAPPDEGTR